jgi:hypothetical protein
MSTYLAGIRTFLFLELIADSPHDAVQADQSLHSDHKHSVGKSSTLIEDSVVEVEVDETESDSSVMASRSTQVLSLSDK